MLTFDAEAHRYSYAGAPVPGVTGVLAPLSDFGAVDPDVMRRASAFGTAVHHVCELDDAGTLGDYEWDEEAIGPYLAAWREFSRAWSVKWEALERRVYHPTLRFGGTLDRFGSLVPPGQPEHRRRRVVVDIKTSTSLYPSVGPQLAAYANAYDPLLARSLGRYAVQLRGDGSYVCQEFADPSDFAVFCALLTLGGWCSKHNITPRF